MQGSYLLRWHILEHYGEIDIFGQSEDVEKLKKIFANTATATDTASEKLILQHRRRRGGVSAGRGGLGRAGGEA